MVYYVSALIRGMKHMEEIALWVDAQKDSSLGVELIAFTHDTEYWQRLLDLLSRLSCPISFHGPYIGVEATSAQKSKGQSWLLESYRRVFSLAASYHITHVVFHYSQLSFTEKALKAAQTSCLANISLILALAEEYKVDCLIENLCRQPKGMHLFTNEEYFEIFRRYPQARPLIDVGHAYVNGLNIEDFLKEFGERVKAYHFHNNDGVRDLHNDIFDGKIDYEAVMKLIKCYTPNANIVLEYEPHTGLSNEELLNHVEWLRRIAKNENLGIIK